MLKFLFVAFAALLACLQVSPAQAKPSKTFLKGSMTFVSLDVSAICSDCSVVQVSGEFGESTMKGYRALLEQGRLKRNVFFVFDSRGGNVHFAMVLGATLRGRKVNTIVGRAMVRNGEVEIEPGVCASACVLAFLGGVTRSMPKDSRLGVHSWMPFDLIEPEDSKDKGKPKLIDQEAFTRLQRITALHLKYLEMMGIDLRVATLTLQTPYTSVAWVSPRDQSLWNVVTIDSKLSTPADRRWPVLFIDKKTAPPLKEDPPGSLRAAGIQSDSQRT